MIFDDGFLNIIRTAGDPMADQLVSALFANGTQGHLYQLLKVEESDMVKQPASAVQSSLITKREAPSWFDENRLTNGQRVFEKYAMEIMTLLGVMSLPYCYAASPGNKALYLSEKMRNAPAKRLMDTAAFVIAVLTPGTLADEGYGHIHINKVRLIHALSRHYIKRHPEWNTDWGLPVNQEDMAGTNLAFSYVILMGLQLSGYSLSQQEKEDLIYTWRYIGYQMHIDENLLPATVEEARRLTDVIQRRNFRKTEEGAILTAELLKYFKSNVASWQTNLVESQIRYYLGREVSDYIGLHQDPIRDTITSFVSDLHALKNIFGIHESTYQDMLSRQMKFKEEYR